MHTKAQSAKTKVNAAKRRFSANKFTGSLLPLAAIMAPVLGYSPLSHAADAPVHAIGIENQYADVTSQIGGKYVEVTYIVPDPQTDPHTFEASPGIARQIASATLSA